ncbi:MAG: iron-sulfur cluster repair di-iron protein [Opitutus sp.]|nr:iron-sulfur cluster repair di-iron protein [Opitutus sp.]
MNQPTTTEVPSFTLETTVGAIVAARPALARIFEKLGIDYCCGGKRPLAELVRARGLDPATVLAMLEAATSALAAGTAEVDAAAMTLTQLADHIEQSHHDYVKAELPRLVEMADRVARKHAWRDERLKEIAETVTLLANEMFSHMAKEETILFPFVRQLEAGAPDAFHCGSIANPIRQMEDEHEFAGRAVARLRELTGGFRPDADACNTHRALLGGLEEFEGDLHRHVHKENNILFPRALAFATSRN